MQTLRGLAFASALLFAAREASALELNEPRSGLHLDVPDACQVKPPGDAACAGFEASAHQAERFAVVLHDGGLLSYSVAIFAAPEPGVGEERARTVAKSLGDADAQLATYGGQRFLRAELHPANGAALCFVTVDDRADVAIVMFASDPTLADAMHTHADEAMRSLRRAPSLAPPNPPARTRTTWPVLITLLVVFALGLPAARLIHRRRAAARKHP